MVKLTTPIFTYEAGTDFEYSITDANNCKPVKGTFTVVQPDPLALAASTKSASCFELAQVL
jgi:hypothetical protein